MIQLFEIMIMIEYDKSTEFQKEFNKLKKKFPTLPDDFELAKKAAIELFHLQNIDNHSVFEVPILKGLEKIFKVKKFACKSLKGRGNKSGIRIIYAFNEKTKRVFFLEIYFKGDKENEDRVRIKQYLKGLERRDHD